MMHLLYTTVGGGLLCALVWLLSRYARGKLSSSTIYGLWMLVGARFLCFGMLPIDKLLGRQKYTPFFMQSKFTTSFYQNPLSSYLYMPENAAESSDSQAVEAAFRNVDFLFERILPILWMVGCAALVLFLILRNVQLRRRLRHAVPIVLSAEHEICYAQLGETLGIARLPNCYHIDFIPSPCLYGVFKPCILIPSEITGDDDRLPHILAHELCHYASYDQVRLLARYIVLVLHWFNPLAWLYFIRAKTDCEHACDQRVLRVLPYSESTSYGATLVSLAHTHGTLWGHSMSAQGKTLKSRLQHILHPSRMKQSAFFTSVLCVSLAAVLSAAGATSTIAETPLYDLTPPPYVDLEALAKLKNNKAAIDEAVALLPVPKVGYALHTASLEDDLEIVYSSLNEGYYIDNYQQAREENNALLLFALYDDLDFIHFIYGEQTEEKIENLYVRSSFFNPIDNLSSIAHLYQDCEDKELWDDVLTVLSQNMRPTTVKLYFDRIGLDSSIQTAFGRWRNPIVEPNFDRAISPDLNYCLFHYESFFSETGEEPYTLISSENIILGYDGSETDGKVRFLLTDGGWEIIRAIAPIEYNEAIDIDINLEYLLQNFHVHQMECNTSGQTLCMISLYTMAPEQYVYFFFDEKGDMMFSGLADNLMALNADNLYDVYYSHCRNYLPS